MKPTAPLLLSLTLLAAGPAAANHMADPQHAPEHAPASQVAAPTAPKLHAAMRSLWHGHIVHAREYAMATHAGDQAAVGKAANAVVANAKQIAGAVGGFYGKPAGERMLQLLGGHWGAVKALTDARAKHDDAGATKAMTDLTANAGEIAKFLAGANPNLPEATVRGLLLQHGADHAQQIGQVMAGDRKGEAETWTHMQAHMDTIADALAGGIAKQFPAKAS